jgi:16S rRNA A1518/A1519 N6-dimethyltransferase RsmA/KsgA/DIM1 with predicted DNA glycosylase/AP lyase activity
MIELIALLVLSVIYIVYFYYWIKAFRISAPYFPTSKKTIKTALKELKNHKVKHIAELGAGDGRVAFALAREGYEVSAIEFNPILVLIMKFRKLIGNYKKVHIIREDFLKLNYEKYDAAFIYLYPKVMDKLAKKLTQEMPKNAVFISNTFMFHDKKPVSTSENKIYVYINEK